MYQMPICIVQIFDCKSFRFFSFLKYELVAELFQDNVDSPSRRGGVTVRPAKEQPKMSSQQKQARKTVGSQVWDSILILQFLHPVFHWS